jgi:hypothetical protein
MCQGFNGFSPKSFSISIYNVQRGIPNLEIFRADFQSHIEQDALPMCTQSRHDGGRPECFAPRIFLVEKDFSHPRCVSREEAGLLNLCEHLSIMS